MFFCGLSLVVHLWSALLFREVLSYCTSPSWARVALDDLEIKPLQPAYPQYCLPYPFDYLCWPENNWDLLVSISQILLYPIILLGIAMAGWTFYFLWTQFRSTEKSLVPRTHDKLPRTSPMLASRSTHHPTPNSELDNTLCHMVAISSRIKRQLASEERQVFHSRQKKVKRRRALRKGKEDDSETFPVCPCSRSPIKDSPFLGKRY